MAVITLKYFTDALETETDLNSIETINDMMDWAIKCMNEGCKIYDSEYYHDLIAVKNNEVISTCSGVYYTDEIEIEKL